MARFTKANRNSGSATTAIDIRRPDVVTGFIVPVSRRELITAIGSARDH